MQDGISPRGRDGVTSDTGAFAITPEWILYSDLSDRAKVLYAILGRYADANGKGFPSRRTLAERARCSVNTLDRTLKELTDAGVIRSEARYSEEGDRTTNLYTVIRVQPGSRTSGATGGPTDEGTGRPTDGEENESQKEREPEGTREHLPATSAGAAYSVPNGVRVDGQNLPWNALVEATGFAGKGAAPRVARALQAIREDTWGTMTEAQRAEVVADPPAYEERLAHAITLAVASLKAASPGLTYGPEGVARHWLRMLRAPSETERLTAAVEAGIEEARHERA